jgi:hypothetical protein
MRARVAWRLLLAAADDAVQAAADLWTWGEYRLNGIRQPIRTRP